MALSGQRRSFCPDGLILRIHENRSKAKRFPVSFQNKADYRIEEGMTRCDEGCGRLAFDTHFVFEKVTRS